MMDVRHPLDGPRPGPCSRSRQSRSVPVHIAAHQGRQARAAARRGRSWRRSRKAVGRRRVTVQLFSALSGEGVQRGAGCTGAALLRRQRQKRNPGWTSGSNRGKLNPALGDDRATRAPREVGRRRASEDARPIRAGPLPEEVPSPACR
ncbi:MAG: hypothetical protein MZV70_62430 [Desulfobacterales bacterium]|nr:hypothetical protein [Desulfobacterales bacterium]